MNRSSLAVVADHLVELRLGDDVGAVRELLGVLDRHMLARLAELVEAVLAGEATRTGHEEILGILELAERVPA